MVRKQTHEWTKIINRNNNSRVGFSSFTWSSLCWRVKIRHVCELCSDNSRFEALGMFFLRNWTCLLRLTSYKILVKVTRKLMCLSTTNQRRGLRETYIYEEEEAFRVEHNIISKRIIFLWFKLNKKSFLKVTKKPLFEKRVYFKVFLKVSGNQREPTNRLQIETFEVKYRSNWIL